MRTAADYQAAAKASGCRVVRQGLYAGEWSAEMACDDPQAGWKSARLLFELGKQAASDPRVTAVAIAVRAVAGGDDDAAARLIQAWVKERVAFVREDVETFAGPGWLLDEIKKWGDAQGDCDCQSQLVYALARAAAVPVAMVFLARPSDGEPAHVLCKLNGEWAETTVDAAYGEHPITAAKRLGLRARTDIGGAGKEITMADEKAPIGAVDDVDVTPLPPARAPHALFDQHQPPPMRTARDYATLVALARVQVPAIDPVGVATVLYWESGFNAHAVNAKGAWGVNQMSRANLGSIGLTPDQWTAMPLEAQLPIVFSFWKRLAKAFNGGDFPSDPAHLYALNFLPGVYKAVGAKDNPDAPLATKGTPNYDKNTTLDPNGLGVITVSTIRDRLTRVAQNGGADWRAVEAGIAAAKAGTGGGGPGVGAAIVAGVVAGVLGAAAIWSAA